MPYSMIILYLIISEEVAAASQESLKVSEKTVSIFNEFKESLNVIFDLANQLKQD